MFSSVLQRLEHLLVEHLGATDLPSLAAEAMRLSDSFTTGRSDIAAGYLDDPRRRLAYIAHFVLTNAAKVLHCLDEADSLGLIPEKKNLCLLDLGCGPGTASLAASIFFAERRPKAEFATTGVERSAPALEDAARLFRKLASPGHRFEPSTGEVGSARAVRGRFDIIIAANVVNELGRDADTRVLCRELFEHHLETNGFLLIVDPALHATTRSLMQLRDNLLGFGARVDAPCLHQQRCPMLAANERDWCHYYIEWQRPKLIERMDALTGLDHRLLKMAYMMFGKAPLVLRQAQDERTPCWRAVSSPLVSKGKREIVLCGANGKLVKMMRQDRHASDLNVDFDDVRRGDVVACSCERKITSTDGFAVRRRWQ